MLLRIFIFLYFFTALLGTAAYANKRVALVIGNSNYKHAGALRNPANDANAIGSKLKMLGFDVVLGIDLDRFAFQNSIIDFARRSRNASVTVIFYAGHGMQVDGRNYLIPVDANIEQKADLRWQTIKVRTLLEEAEGPGKTSIVIMDACRNNPLTRRLRNLSRSGTRTLTVGNGLARMTAPLGSYIVFATAPDDVAADGDGDHSPFTAALLKRIDKPNLDIAHLMRAVRHEVHSDTNGTQTPWSNSSLFGGFSFNPVKLEKAKPEISPPSRTAPPTTEAKPRMDVAAEWQATEKVGTCEAYQAFAAAFPKTFYAKLASAWQAKHCSPESVVASIKPTDSLTTSPKVSPTVTPANETDHALAVKVQLRLKQLGCYNGPIDGKWGSGSKAALRSALQVSKADTKINETTIERLSYVKPSACKRHRVLKARTRTTKPLRPKPTAKINRTKPAATQHRPQPRKPKPTAKRIVTHKDTSEACRKWRRCFALYGAGRANQLYMHCTRPKGCQ